MTMNLRMMKVEVAEVAMVDSIAFASMLEFRYADIRALLKYSCS
jgi:hypothetical protein